MVIHPARIPRLISLLLPALAALAAEPSFPSLARPALLRPQLRVLSPSVLEISVVTAAPAEPPPDGPLPPPPVPELRTEDFAIEAAGGTVAAQVAGFHRRPLYAPLRPRDLRISHAVILRLPIPLASPGRVTVRYSGAWTALRGTGPSVEFVPGRPSPAVHINQAGYLPDAPKLAFFGYYLGTAGELDLPDGAGFALLDAAGQAVLEGSLVRRGDSGLPFPWYRQVWTADFSAWREPGWYRVRVEGVGCSPAFRIDAGAAALLARTYALGLYQQRCGTAVGPPFSRHAHGPCHTAPATVPAGRVRSLPGFPETAEDADLYPFVRSGPVDVSGGHHDAGDYGKYTINGAGLIHALVFAADAFAGVGRLDNLGLPESGDGRSDLLQEAKWEADLLMRLQDDDGGFHFLVYPRDRRYEHDVPPDRGDPQIVWPKQSAATAAAVAALAQCAGSPRFRREFPADADRCLAAARRGWAFLLAAEARHGPAGTYRRFTHYGDEFGDADEKAWAATELFLATGDPALRDELSRRLDPADPRTRKWGWRRLTEGYGRAIRSYAFGVRTGRVPAEALDARYLRRCEDEIIAGAEDWVRASEDCAYATSYPGPSKRVLGGGWYFGGDAAFDLVTACQLDFPPRADRREAFRTAALANLAYDTGANPNGVCFLTGVGWRRPRILVHQQAQNDWRALPPSGLPVGSLCDGFTWTATYKGELGAWCHPLDGDRRDPYPILDRWGDAYNLQTEFVIVNQGRALAAAAWLMAGTPAAHQPWRGATARITAEGTAAGPGRARTFRLESPDLALRDAVIVWDAEGLEPAFGGERHELVPPAGGLHRLEAEACLPDGRRVSAAANPPAP